MTDTFYPELPAGAAWALSVIMLNAEEDGSYLENSPYSDEEIAILKRFCAAGGDFEELLDPNESKWERLERESRELFRDLLTEKENLNVKDSAEKMSYFRTAASLLDKIVGIQERAANLKQIHRFHDTVLRVMEDVLDASQRTEVMDRLRKAIQPGE